MAQRPQTRRDPRYGYDETSEDILIGYDDYGNPIYGTVDLSGGDQGTAGPSTGGTPEPDSGNVEPTATDIDSAIKANRELRARTEKSGWYEVSPGKWEQSSEYIRAVSDLDSKYNALMGQKRLLETQKPAPGKDIFYRGNNAYRWTTGPDGKPVAELVNTFPTTPAATPQRAPRHADEIEAAQLANELTRQNLSKWPVEQDQWNKNYGRLLAGDEETRTQNAWQRALDQQKLKQLESQNRMANTLNMFQNLQQGQLQAAPYALRPGQQWYGGYEPGGVMQSIARMSGRYYDPDQYKVKTIDFDQAALWQQAQENLRRILDEYDNQPDEEAPYGQTHLRR
ncbi:MAG: hypothetical protein EPO21_14825 [Chloroflexota bacterium]|nr:MAG: hypothetical protein EPO21_14825 [Chloroflexota bacterium]